MRRDRREWSSGLLIGSIVSGRGEEVVAQRWLIAAPEPKTGKE
jgi:hypothetical protein